MTSRKKFKREPALEPAVASPAEVEHDKGYGPSHGYGPGHGGPSGPGDVPGDARAPAGNKPPATTRPDLEDETARPSESGPGEATT